MVQLTLAVLDNEFTVHSFDENHRPDAEIFEQEFYFIGKTQDELSVVVPSSLSLASDAQEAGWCCLEVLGPLGFSMVGIMARLSTTLAEVNISILAISTFDTDYLLVKKKRLADATKALKANGYQVLAKKSQYQEA
ncbi:amino acid-binding protein [Paraferrimonas haliotis]|uniref:Amino acid-binding protein n=1 Tax=Paraferrimonas haliotis TaxID=2013866 RepID=A0AA37TS19_9GAMM|nr:amino acid-binding protein [Paraferrimonas haliotis]